VPLPTILSTEQLIQQRQNSVASAQYVLFNPNDLVWQTQPNAQVDGAVPYAKFAWNGTVDGDRANVQVGMTVVISTSTAYRTTAIFRGRVRVAPDGTDFFIDENSTNLEITYYVTVLDDYDLHERQERRSADGISRYADWNKTFEALPPTISGLQSTYVDVTGAATITLVLVPTVTANAEGAAISTYLWDVGDGTITVGTSADKDITATFPGAVTNEHRWVRLTVTDDNSVSQYFVFEVYSIDLASTSSVVSRLETNAVAVTGTRQQGFNVTVKMTDDFDTVLDRTRCTLVSIDDYGGIRSLAFTSGGTTEITVDATITGGTGGATATVVAVDLDSGSWAGGDAVGTLWINQQVGDFEAEDLDVGASSNLATIATDSINPPITQNVSFVGRLNREANITRGDEIFSQVQEGQMIIEGFATQLGRMHGPGIYLVNDTTPTDWGEINTMTVGRAVVYMLSWYSTALNIFSFSLPSDINDYDWPEYSIQPAPLKTWIESVTNDINAFLIFAASGECAIARHASYAGVGGLDTILELKIDSSGVSDVLDFNLELEYVATHSSAIVGAATHNTTLDTETIYQGRAPSQVFGPGWENAPIDSQIMKSDLTAAQAKAEAGSRVSSHLAFVNPKARLNLRLPSGYYWLVPTDNQLYAFDIAAADNVGGRVFTSSDKWLCVEVSYFYDSAIGGYEVNATFEEVTTGGNYGIVVNQIMSVTDLTYPELPPIGAGLGLVDLQVNFPELGTFDMPGVGAESGYPETVPPGCEVLNINLRNGAIISTSNISQSGETYTVTVEGDGGIESILYSVDLLNGNGQGALLPGTTAIAGHSFGPGVYKPITDDFRSEAAAISGGGTPCDVKYSLPENTILRSVYINMDAQRFATTPSGEKNTAVALDGVIVASSSHGVGTYLLSQAGGNAFPNSSGLALSGSVLQIHDSMDKRYSDGALATIVRVRFTYTTDTKVKGDAFYYDYQDGVAATLYTTSHGLLVGGVKPGNVPLYSSNHSYTFTLAGTGGVFQFEWDDPYGDYSDNDNVNLVITVCGVGMEQAVF